MSHTITVTRITNDPSPEVDTDDPEYVIEGEHDHRCMAYGPCEKGWHRHPKNDEGQYGYDEWSTKRIREHHAWIEGEWMVPLKNRCGLDLSFEHDNPEFQMTSPGVYDVEVEWDGEWWIASLALRPAVPETAGDPKS